MPVTLCLLGSVVLFIEGIICVIMALPLFWFMSIAVLPLIMLPIESSVIFPAQERWVTTSVTIDATPEAVWQSFIDVQDIQEEELGFSIANLMDFPRPLRADMQGAEVGALRVSTWEKGVVFGERITQWEPHQTVSWDFEIDPEAIPPKALDQHVKLGGRFWTVLKGQYHLEPLPTGQTSLVLRTLYWNNTSWLLPYGNMWSDFLLDDFHASILHLVKHRSEQS